MIISSCVRWSVMVVLLAHSLALAITQTQSIPRGQVVERVEALSDASQSYARYLPSNYTPDRKWPVLYAFDSGARGRAPVERLKTQRRSTAESSLARTIHAMVHGSFPLMRGTRTEEPKRSGGKQLRPQASPSRRKTLTHPTLRRKVIGLLLTL